MLFLPLYSSELNPAELVWLNMKRKTTNAIYKTTEELKIKIDEIVNDLITQDFIKSYVASAIFLIKIRLIYIHKWY